MSKSLIIVAFALASLHGGVSARQSSFVNNDNMTENVPITLLVASGGNPWALPDPNAEYGYPDAKQQPAPRVYRPRYITPEEMKQLGHLPPERNYYGPARVLPGTNGKRGVRPYTGTMPRGYGYYGQGSYPLGSQYGAPYGTSPSYDPYGGGSSNLPYGGGILPFLY